MKIRDTTPKSPLMALLVNTSNLILDLARITDHDLRDRQSWKALGVN